MGRVDIHVTIQPNLLIKKQYEEMDKLIGNMDEYGRMYKPDMIYSPYTGGKLKPYYEKSGSHLVCVPLESYYMSEKHPKFKSYINNCSDDLYFKVSSFDNDREFYTGGASEMAFLNLELDQLKDYDIYTELDRNDSTLHFCDDSLALKACFTLDFLQKQQDEFSKRHSKLLELLEENNIEYRIGLDFEMYPSV